MEKVNNYYMNNYLLPEKQKEIISIEENIIEHEK